MNTNIRRITFIIFLVVASCQQPFRGLISSQTILPSIAATQGVEETQSATLPPLIAFPTAGDPGTNLAGAAGNDCIPPVASLAFPVWDQTQPPLTNSTPIPPGEPWQYVTNLPLQGPIKSMVIRAGKEIWITLLNDSPGVTLRYSLDNGDWTSYATIEGIKTDAGLLQVGPDGTLWGIGANFNKLSDPWLSFYNQQADKFEFVRDRDGLLQFAKYAPDSLPARAAIENNGTIWMLLAWRTEHSLVSFDPTSRTAVKQLDADPDSWFSSLAFGSDGSIWLLEKGHTNQLLHFFPSTKLIQPYQGNPDSSLDDFGNENLRDSQFLYFDRLGNLWVDDRGWFDFRGPFPLWNRVIRSPVFIIDGSRPENRYAWGRPASMYQSSDGTYWFQSLDRTVQLNPSTGTWCTFTNDGSPIVEDGEHNLWMVAFGKLYKYALHQ